MSNKAKGALARFDAVLESFLTRPRVVRFSLWQALLVGLGLVVVTLMFAALAARGAAAPNEAGALARAAAAVAEAPRTAANLVKDVVTGKSVRLAATQRFPGESGFRRATPSPSLGDAVALSRFDGDRRRGLVELIDLEAGDVIHAWRPDAKAIHQGSKIPSADVNLNRDFGPERYVPYSPVVGPDGSLVFHGMDSPLIKIDACSRLVWRVDGVFHHSLERDAEGDFWTARRLPKPTTPMVGPDFQDDAIVEISPEGEILFERSVAAILVKSGLRHEVYSSDHYDPDPLHLNDVQPALVDGVFWRKGDLLLSLRNPSMAALYRPSTDELLWSRQGPWLMQHDLDFVDDRTISVFDNNAAAAPAGERVLGVNVARFYDIESGESAEPFAAAFAAAAIKTRNNGLMELTSDGGLMVEEQNFGRLLAVDRDGKTRWSYVNRARDGRVYTLGWSRYIPPAEAGALRAALASASCSPAQGRRE